MRACMGISEFMLLLTYMCFDFVLGNRVYCSEMFRFYKENDLPPTRAVKKKTERSEIPVRFYLGVFGGGAMTDKLCHQDGTKPVCPSM